MKLSQVQKDLIDRLKKESLGARIERRKGGFWTAPETISTADGVPDWWVSTHTVDALVRKGVLVDPIFNEGYPNFPVGYRLAPEWRLP